jgi:hypothetical protein
MASKIGDEGSVDAIRAAKMKLDERKRKDELRLRAPNAVEVMRVRERRLMC